MMKFHDTMHQSANEFHSQARAQTLPFEYAPKPLENLISTTKTTDRIASDIS